MSPQKLNTTNKQWQLDRVKFKWRGHSGMYYFDCMDFNCHDWMNLWDTSRADSCVGLVCRSILCVGPDSWDAFDILPIPGSRLRATDRANAVGHILDDYFSVNLRKKP